MFLPIPNLIASSPTLWLTCRRVGDLKHFATALFEREGRALRLTERGRLLLTEAPELLTRVHALPALLGGQGDELHGDLRVTASTAVGRYLLASALAAFAGEHPAVAVSLVIGKTETALATLHAHQPDVAYVEGSVARSDMLAESWRTDQMAIIVSPRRWKLKARRLPRSHVQKTDWIMRELDSSAREVLENALRNAKLTPAKTLLTFDDSEAVLQVVASGIGVACLSRLVVAESLRSKRVMTLETPYLTLERTLWRVTRRRSRLGPLHHAFHAFVQQRA
ncbi:MAG: hypothetical protein HYX63_04025 [Gammaproteobacteria bacterium]|nr:hypothetical protein [Gammaproteobacteria bacterium]